MIVLIQLVRALGFALVVSAVAVAFLVMGNLAGRLIGGVMLLALALWVWRRLWPWFRRNLA